MAKRTPHVPTDQAVTATALCDAHRHQLCPGKIVSLTAAHGQPCACACHRREEVAA
jgi:hypothetical protein